MFKLDTNYELIEPFIEHQGEQRNFWLRKPRLIGEKCLIARKDLPIKDLHRNKTIILLDFKNAFGTGGHGTTEGCLIALEKFIKGGETVLDVGTGTGILAIAAHKLGSVHVTAIDIEKSACRETEKNLALNKINNGVDVFHGGIELVNGRFGVIAANLRTPILAMLMDEIIKKLNNNGTAIFSGILERELPGFISFLENYPMETVEIKRIHGWMTMVLKKH